MPSFEGLLLGGTLLLLALAALGLFAVLRRSAATPATDALGRGSFAETLERAQTGTGAGREEIFVAAVAAKHLLDFDLAAALLDRLTAADPGDGEAWLERGLVHAYSAAAEAAEQALARALAARSDLAESITLHRAWLALRLGDLATARHLFDEVEAPLETKLRSDLGEGEPLFAEWFLHAAALWEALGEDEKARWARRAAREAAPESRLPDLLGA
jgi:tetratricopeptide (TPR) repeat protein